MIEALFFLVLLISGLFRRLILFPIILLYNIIFKYNDY